MSTETSPLLHPVSDELLQDPTSSLPGYVASEVAQEEQDANYKTIASSLAPIKPLSWYKTNLIISSMYFGIYLAAVDGTIVTTLSNHIASEFNALPTISWIATSYLLSNATFQPLYGKISDIYGRRPLLVFCNIVFAIGCLICGVTTDFWTLVLGRFIAGIGGGGLTSLSSITTSDLIPLRDRALYQGICNICFGLGTASGGFIGGLCADTWGWRMGFLSQVPLTLLSTVLIWVFLELPEGSSGAGIKGNHGEKLLSIDWFGSISLVGFLLSFMFLASVGGKEWSFDSPMFISLSVFGVICLFLFVYIELYVARQPILPIRFLADRTVLGSSLSNFFSMMAMITLMYYLPIYWQSVLNLTTTQTGQRLAPNFFSTAFGSLGAGWYMKHTGKYKTFVISWTAFAVLGVFQVLMIQPTIATWKQFLLLVCPGFGTSVLITVTLLSMIAAVPHEHQAATTSISYLFRSSGATLGMSIGSAVFRAKLSSNIETAVNRFSDKHSAKELAKIIEKATHSSDYMWTDAPKYVRQALITSYHYACKTTFFYTFVCMCLALVSVSIIREHKLHSSMSREEQLQESDV